MESLSLSGNLIESVLNIIWTGLGRLIKLDMSSNLIESVDRVHFDGLATLKHLDLGANKISSINNSIITGLPKLAFIDLRSNRITFLDNIYRDISHLEKIGLESNPISSISLANSDCDKFKFRIYLLSSYRKVNTLSKLIVDMFYSYPFWFKDQVDFKSVNLNLHLFHRGTIRLMSNRSINIYQSIPVFSRDISKFEIGADYFFELYRKCKIARFQLGDYKSYDSFIARVVSTDLGDFLR